MKIKFKLQVLALIIALLIGVISISGVGSEHVKLDTIGATNLAQSADSEQEVDELRAVIRLRR